MGHKTLRIPIDYYANRIQIRVKSLTIADYFMSFFDNGQWMTICSLGMPDWDDLNQ
jgi:Zn/Cd-binding protein ZinT